MYLEYDVGDDYYKKLIWDSQYNIILIVNIRYVFNDKMGTTFYLNTYAIEHHVLVLLGISFDLYIR